MSSMVLELQRQAMDGNSDVTDLLRRALVAATKLKLDDFRQWVEWELLGYGDNPLPKYRKIHVELKAYNPYHGWVPVILQDPAAAKAATQAEVPQSVAQLQELLARRDPQGRLAMPLDPELAHKLMNGFEVPLEPTRLVDPSQIAGILHAVRNAVLEWSLRLEQNGILGEGMTFSHDERKKAASTQTINIQSFHGVLGDVRTEQLQIGDQATILGKLKELGIEEEQRRELIGLLKELKDSQGEKAKSLANKIVNWTSANIEKLGSFAKTIWSFIQPYL